MSRSQGRVDGTTPVRTGDGNDPLRLDCERFRFHTAEEGKVKHQLKMTLFWSGLENKGFDRTGSPTWTPARNPPG
jgi:hypothetical protein